MIDSWYVKISPWKQIIQIVSWYNSDLVKNKNNERRITKTLNVFSSSSNRAGGGQSRWWAFFFLERGCRQESSCQLFFQVVKSFFLTCACLFCLMMVFWTFFLSRWRSCQLTICQTRHRWATSNDGLVYGTLRKKAKQKSVLLFTKRYLDTIIAKICFSLSISIGPRLPRTVWLCVLCFPMFQGTLAINVQPPSKPKVQQSPPPPSLPPTHPAKITYKHRKKKKITHPFSLTTVHKKVRTLDRD